MGDVEKSTSNLGVEENLPLDDDTFEQILHVTTQHDALMAFYYTDSNNKVWYVYGDEKDWINQFSLKWCIHYDSIQKYYTELINCVPETW